jgi:predicted NACHT family NTPase
MAATAASVGQGGMPDLFRIYAGLDSGRVLVLGSPGTGKSAAAILTVLDALKQRQRLDDLQRAQVPVPVILTAQGWDPYRHRLDEWLAARLNAEYAFLRSGFYGPNVAARLVESGLVALVLDGFDEIADDLRSVALRALDEQATGPRLSTGRHTPLVLQPGLVV